MRKVSPGDPIFPAMSAEWYNATLDNPKFIGGQQQQVQTHQNIIRCKVAAGSDDISIYDPVYIYQSYKQRIHTDLNLVVTKANDLLPVHIPWGVAQAAAKPDGIIDVVFDGVTWCNVNFTSPGPGLNYLGTYRAACFGTSIHETTYGQARILTYPPEDAFVSGTKHRVPVVLGTPYPDTGIAKITEAIPARDGNQLYSKLGDIYIINEYNILVKTPYQRNIFNTQEAKVKPGFIQYKSVQNKLVVDVSPC